MVWYFQSSPHDTHDWDATQTPVLFDGTINGQPRKLLAQASRNGQFFVLDRTNGKAIVSTEYIKTNWSLGYDAKGQPIPNPAKRPQIAGALVTPNQGGATNWYPPSFSPQTGLFYVNATRAFSVWYIYDASDNPTGLGRHRSRRLRPKPQLKAIDYKTGKIRWSIPRYGGNSGILSTAGNVLFTRRPAASAPTTPPPASRSGTRASATPSPTGRSPTSSTACSTSSSAAGARWSRSCSTSKRATRSCQSPVHSESRVELVSRVELSPDCRAPSPEPRVPSPESRIPNPESRIPNPESRSRVPSPVDGSVTVKGDVMLYTRREMGKLALATVPAAALSGRPLAAFAAKPDSKVVGVQIRLNVPYDFGNNMMSGDEVLDGCVKLGISAVELRSQPVEQFMGVPAGLLAGPGRRRAPRRNRRLPARPRPTNCRNGARPLRRAERRSSARSTRMPGSSFNRQVPDNIPQLQRSRLDHAFELAKTLGARAISCELPVDQVEGAKRLGQFADKHKIMIGFHGHLTMTPAIWEKAFSYAKYNGANLDIGHFISGNKTSPVPFLNSTTTASHMCTSRTRPSTTRTCRSARATPRSGGPAADPGQQVEHAGDDRVPYPVPTGSDRMTEIAKSIQFCRDALAQPKT